MVNQNISEEAIVKAVIKALEKMERPAAPRSETGRIQAQPERHRQTLDKAGPQPSDAGEESLIDIAMIPEEEICFVKNPKNKEALMRLKRSTPARTATGRVGDREKTAITIRKMANLSAAVDAVWTPLNKEFVRALGYPILKSMPESKEEYLMRPDLGVLLDEENRNIVRTQLKKNPDVQIIIGEGQSNQGLEKSMPELLPALLQGLEANQIDYGTPCFVEYTRVGIGDLIGQEVGAKAVCVVLGERPGLLSWDGLGCYITYGPKVGVLESKRTCVSNIQDNGGTPPAEAGAYIADLISRILKEGKSGVDLII